MMATALNLTVSETSLLTRVCSAGLAPGRKYSL